MVRPRIHLYMPCWNEAVLLPHFFRHYGFVERFVIFDNGSTDATRALIAAEPRAELREFDTGGEIDERAYLRIKNEAWKESRGTADFVIVCDTDEFLFHSALDRVLDRMRAEEATVLRPAGYDMVGDRVPGPDEDLLQAVPAGVRRYEFDKCMLFDPAAIAEIRYGIGGHNATPTGRVRLFSRPGLALLHYKYLGLAYVRGRYDAAASRLGAFNRANGYGEGYTEPAQRTAMRLRMLAHTARRIVPAPGEAPPPIDDAPADLAAVRSAARAALATKRWADARAGLERVLAWRPDDRESMADLAYALRRLGLLNEAGWCFRHALSLDPRRWETWFGYGNLLLAGRHPARARECFDQAVRWRPDHAPSWTQLGAAHAAAGDIAAAEAAWRTAVAHAPSFVPALRRLGRHLVDAGRAEEAAPVLRAWAAAAPGDAAAAAAVAALAS